MRGRDLGKPRTTIWVDQLRTKTAADIVELGECDALIHRITRNIDELKAQGAHHAGAPRPLVQALFYRTQGLRALEKRRKHLASSH